MPWGFKIPIVVLPAFVLALFIPGVRFQLLSALGRTNGCTLRRDLEVSRFVSGMASAEKAIQASTQVLKLDGEFTLLRTRDGDYWIPQRNSGGLAYNLAEEEQDIYGPNSVSHGDIVLDGGANVGVFTRKALNAGARLVVAVEPAPENVESLRRTFAPEIAAGQVVIEPVGLWNQPGELPLMVDAKNSARDSLVLNFGQQQAIVKVPLTTIDAIAEKLALPGLNLIKLDIEGAEKNAIAGGRRTLARFHPRMSIATEHFPDDPTAIPAAINALNLGYETICGPCSFDRNSVSLRPDAMYFLSNQK
jgi:FkbM family methyltransferase